jgi:hypothetical protein
MNETNNWDGKITKEMFDLSQVGTDYATFNNLTKRYLINCLVGNAHLTGDGNGSLLEYFDELMEEVVESGEIAVIEKAQSKYLAIPKKLNESLLKAKVAGENGEVIEPVIKYEFTLLDNSNIKYHSKDVDKYVIFKLNREGSALLTGLSFWTKRLTNILVKMEKEMFMNEKRLIFFSPETPATADTKKWLKSFTDGIMTLITFDKSANPDKQAISEGKQGINPNLVKFEVYEPKEFQEEKYRNQFAFVWNNMERAYGIRHDTLQEKEERASVTEVFSSQANFDAQEKKIYRLLSKSIREYNRIFDKGEANYQFKYGRIGN